MLAQQEHAGDLMLAEETSLGAHLRPPGPTEEQAHLRACGVRGYLPLKDEESAESAAVDKLRCKKSQWCAGLDPQAGGGTVGVVPPLLAAACMARSFGTFPGLVCGCFAAFALAMTLWLLGWLCLSCAQTEAPTTAPSLTCPAGHLLEPTVRFDSEDGAGAGFECALCGDRRARREVCGSEIPPAKCGGSCNYYLCEGDHADLLDKATWGTARQALSIGSRVAVKSGILFGLASGTILGGPVLRAVLILTMCCLLLAELFPPKWPIHCEFAWEATICKFKDIPPCLCKAALAVRLLIVLVVVLVCRLLYEEGTMGRRQQTAVPCGLCAIFVLWSRICVRRWWWLRKADVVKEVLHAGLFLGLTGALCFDLPKLLSEVNMPMPDILSSVERLHCNSNGTGNFTLMNLTCMGNVSLAWVSMPQPWPTCDELQQLSTTDKVARATFWLTFLVLTGFVGLVAGTLMLGSPRRQAHAQIENSLQSEDLQTLTAHTALSHLTLCTKVLLRCAFTGTLSAKRGVDFEAWAQFFVAGIGWLLLQAAAVCYWKPCSEWELGTFFNGCVQCLAPFISKPFDTVKDVLFAASALAGDTKVSKVIGGLSLGYTWWAYLTALSSPSQRLEFQAAFLPCLTDLPRAMGPPTPEAPAEAPELGLCESLVRAAKRTMLWGIYGQTRESKVRGLVHDDVPQAVLASAFAINVAINVALTQKGESGTSLARSALESCAVVLALNIALPVCKLLCALLFRDPLAHAAVEQIAQEFAKRAAYNDPAAGFRAGFTQVWWRELEHVANLEPGWAWAFSSLTQKRLEEPDYFVRLVGDSLANATSRFEVRAFRLESHGVSDKGARALAIAIASLRVPCTTLILAGNPSISDEAVVVLAEAARARQQSSCPLTCLNLDGCRLGDRGHAALKKLQEDTPDLVLYHED